VTVRLPVIVEDHTQPELDLNGSRGAQIKLR
jgi:hypothetical protein